MLVGRLDGIQPCGVSSRTVPLGLWFGSAWLCRHTVGVRVLERLRPAQNCCFLCHPTQELQLLHRVGFGGTTPSVSSELRNNKPVLLTVFRKNRFMLKTGHLLSCVSLQASQACLGVSLLRVLSGPVLAPLSQAQAPAHPRRWKPSLLRLPAGPGCCPTGQASRAEPPGLTRGAAWCGAALASSGVSEKVEGHKAINSIGERAAGFDKFDKLHCACITSVNVCSSCLWEAKRLVGECSQNVQPQQVSPRRPSCRGLFSGRTKHSPGQASALHFYAGLKWKSEFMSPGASS